MGRVVNWGFREVPFILDGCFFPKPLDKMLSVVYTVYADIREYVRALLSSPKELTEASRNGERHLVRGRIRQSPTVKGRAFLFCQNTRGVGAPLGRGAGGSEKRKRRSRARSGKALPPKPQRLYRKSVGVGRQRRAAILPKAKRAEKCDTRGKTGDQAQMICAQNPTEANQ